MPVSGAFLVFTSTAQVYSGTSGDAHELVYEQFYQVNFVTFTLYLTLSRWRTHDQPHSKLSCGFQLRSQLNNHSSSPDYNLEVRNVTLCDRTRISVPRVFFLSFSQPLLTAVHHNMPSKAKNSTENASKKIPDIRWNNDGGALTWKLIAQLDKDENRHIFQERQKKRTCAISNMVLY